MGGNQVYDLVTDTAARIWNGEIEVAVVTAAETLRTRRGDKAAGRRTPYLPEPEGAAPDELLGSAEPLSNEVEERFGVSIASTFYAMAETAIRHRTGESVETHRARIARLWARGSEIAAGNPDAWIREAMTAEQVATVTDRNRPVAAPYPKLMVSNLDVDQGGAVVMCSVGAAEAAGVARDRWIFPVSGVGAHDHWFVTNRWSWAESPAMRLAANRTLELAGVGHDDCELLDLYSCFPSAVQIAQRELAIAPDRPWTITGGLTFSGGPLNCYCIMPLTRAVGLLRDGAERAFLTGNGGWFTKHSAMVLAAAPGRPASAPTTSRPRWTPSHADRTVNGRRPRPSRRTPSCTTARANRAGDRLPGRRRHAPLRPRDRPGHDRRPARRRRLRTPATLRHDGGAAWPSSHAAAFSPPTGGDRVRPPGSRRR